MCIRDSSLSLCLARGRFLGRLDRSRATVCAQGPARGRLLRLEGLSFFFTRTHMLSLSLSRARGNTHTHTHTHTHTCTHTHTFTHTHTHSHTHTLTHSLTHTHTHSHAHARALTVAFFGSLTVASSSLRSVTNISGWVCVWENAQTVEGSVAFDARQ